MRTFRVLFLTALSLAGWMSSARADYLQIVAFGDSLSDTGNVMAVAGFPLSPYYAGRFSNGPVWVEHLANKFGVGPIPGPSVLGGTNHAWAGAESGGGFDPDLGVPNLLTQVGAFSLTSKIASNQLVTVWAGGNDFLNGQTNPYIPANNIATAITELAKVGGKKFVVPNLPMLDELPFAQPLPADQKAGLRSLTGAFNSKLKMQLTQLEKDLGVKIYQVDTASLFNDIQSNPAHYGFTNVSAAAFDDGVMDGNGYLFWDGVHPTSAAHALIADAAFAQATPEPSTFFLMATAAAGFVAWRRRTSRMNANCDSPNELRLQV